MTRGRTTIAARRLRALDKDGREFEITLSVGEPYETPERDWACPASLAGLHERLVDAHGVDSWQALQSAYQLAIQMLAYFVADGGKLLSFEEREPVQLDELVPQLPRVRLIQE